MLSRKPNNHSFVSRTLWPLYIYILFKNNENFAIVTAWKRGHKKPLTWNLYCTLQHVCNDEVGLMSPNYLHHNQHWLTITIQSLDYLQFRSNWHHKALEAELWNWSNRTRCRQVVGCFNQFGGKPLTRVCVFIKFHLLFLFIQVLLEDFWQPTS